MTTAITAPRPTVAPPSPVPTGPGRCESHTSTAGGDIRPDDGHAAGEAHGIIAVVPRRPLGERLSTSPTSSAGYLELRVISEMLEDAMRARIAASNRAERGGVDPAIYRDQLDALAAAEHNVALAMRRCYRRVAPASVVAWQRDTPGIGEHLLARLLGIIGDPHVARPHRWEGDGAEKVLVAEEPYERTVSQLWAYCGHGDPARRKRVGMTQAEAFGLGSPRAKMLVHLLAEACMKQIGTGQRVSETQGCLAGMNGGEPTRPPEAIPAPARRRSPYRDVYDEARERYSDRVHAAACVRCGPSGKPAVEGSPWSAAHQHAAALRLVGKELLRGLWVAAA